MNNYIITNTNTYCDHFQLQNEFDYFYNNHQNKYLQYNSSSNYYADYSNSSTTSKDNTITNCSQIESNNSNNDPSCIEIIERKLIEPNNWTKKSLNVDFDGSKTSNNVSTNEFKLTKKRKRTKFSEHQV
jgi:hypothetical protein